jgi:hypothetical protein
VTIERLEAEQLLWIDSELEDLPAVVSMNSLPKAFISGSAFSISIAAIAALPLTVLAVAKRRRLI